MIGFTRKRDERIKELEAEVKRLGHENWHLKRTIDRLPKIDPDLKAQAIKADKARIDQEEHTKRFQAKAGVSKEVIREMREAIKVAIISINDLANRTPNQVTAAHLHDLAHEANQLKRFTSLS